MSIEIQQVIKSGGKNLINVLTYCVFRQKFDPVFLTLVKNYQSLPSSEKALALYENFVEGQSPLGGNISITKLDVDWALSSGVEKIYKFNNKRADASEDELEDLPAQYFPERYLFDSTLKRVLENSLQLADIENSYDLNLSALENLPGGNLTPSQRQFNEKVWKPARQRLAHAGFFTIANIGG